MNKKGVFAAVFFIISELILTTAQAASPVWTFAPVPGFPPAVTVSSSGTATVKYTVTNQSHKSHTLEMIPIQGITPSGCTSPLGYLQSCTLNLDVDGSALAGDVTSGPVLCESGNPLQCYQPSQANSLAIHLTSQLVASVSSLNLSINCQPISACPTTRNAALTGNPRQIIIRNTGAHKATNVSVNATGLPLGTSITSNTCVGTLNANSSCMITLTPGDIASSDLSNTACTAGTPPVAGTVTITADGGTPINVSILVLSYGCQYQGGFMFSVDDTTSNTQSIGGKVVSLVDQAQPSTGVGPGGSSIIWSSNGDGGSSADVDYRAILGIDEQSTTTIPSPTAPAYPPGTPPFTPCDGRYDGACDSSNIISYYNFNRVSGGSAPTPLTFYAAGICDASISGYDDWYLPALCEMDATNGGFCPITIQNILTSLPFLIGDYNAPTPSTSCNPPVGTECLAGVYWSSTESNFDPSGNAWYELWYSGGSSQADFLKNSRYGVRCSRSLTN